MGDFERELRLSFLNEWSQHVADVDLDLAQENIEAASSAIVEKSFRLAHNLKGASRVVGFAELSAFNHRFANFLLKIKDGSVALNNTATSLCIRSVRHIKQWIVALEDNPNSVLADTETLVNLLTLAVGISKTPSVIKTTTIQIPKKTAEMPELHASRATQMRSLDQLLQLSGDLALYSNTSSLSEELARLSTEIQNVALEMRRIHLDDLLNRALAFADQTAVKRGKSLQTEFIKSNLKIDREVIDTLNSWLCLWIDHLVEHTASATKLQIRTSSKTGIFSVHLEIDGSRAVKQNFQDLCLATGLNGKIDNLQGTQGFEYFEETGTTISLTLPVNPSIINGLIVRVADDRYVIPLNQIYEFGENDATFMQSKAKLPTVHLSDLLQMTRESTQQSAERMSLTVRSPQGLVHLGVDQVIGKCQFVLRKFGPELCEVQGFMGATVFSDGKPVLILKLKDFLEANEQEVAA